MVIKILEKYESVYLDKDGKIIDRVKERNYTMEFRQELLCEFLNYITTLKEPDIINYYCEKFKVKPEVLISSIKSQTKIIKTNKELKEEIKSLNTKLEEMNLEYKEKIETYEMLKKIINKMTNEEDL